MPSCKVGDSQIIFRQSLRKERQHDILHKAGTRITVLGRFSSVAAAEERDHASIIGYAEWLERRMISEQPDDRTVESVGNGYQLRCCRLDFVMF